MQSTLSSPSEVSLNHYKHLNSVDNSLILLEGQVTLPEGIKCQENEILVSGQDSENGVSNNLSNFQKIHVLVNHNGSCQEWPVVEGNFKAFVKLNKGVNNVDILCPELHSCQNLTLVRTKPANQSRYVRVVYIKCSDSHGTFDSPENTDNDVDMAIKKLRFNALLLQTFTAVDMFKHGFGFQTFQLEEDENGEVVVHVFDSKLTTEKAHGMSGGQLYDWFHSELTHSSLNDANCKFLSFMSCTHYDPPDDMDIKQTSKYVKAHTALGGGRLGLFGTGGLHTWASDVGDLVRCFTNTTKIDKTKLFDDSAGRGSYWANYSTTLGAAIHELGHCFDLAHTPDGIMGRGFDDMNHFATVTSKEKNQTKTDGVEKDIDASQLTTTEMVDDATHCTRDTDNDGTGHIIEASNYTNDGTQITMQPPNNGIELTNQPPRDGTQLTIQPHNDGTQLTIQPHNDGTQLTIQPHNDGPQLTIQPHNDKRAIHVQNDTNDGTILPIESPRNDGPQLTTADMFNNGHQPTIHAPYGATTVTVNTEHTTESTYTSTGIEITTEVVNDDGTDITTVKMVANHNTECTTETTYTSSETFSEFPGEVPYGIDAGTELATMVPYVGGEVTTLAPYGGNFTTDGPIAGTELATETANDGMALTTNTTNHHISSTTNEMVNRGDEHTPTSGVTNHTTVTNGVNGLTTQAPKSTNLVPTTVHAGTTTGIFNDHRAHWYRSSAVILHYSKWFTPRSSSTDENNLILQVNWSSNVKGPVGNGGEGQKNQTFFDDVNWCKEYDLVIAGYAVYHGKYIHAIQPLTTTTLAKLKLKDDPIRGRVDAKCSLSTFLMEDEEYLTSVEVRTGAWVDGIRLHTNRKSSIWFGGRGGNWSHLKPGNEERITGLFGTFGEYIGSLGIHVGERPPLKDEVQIDLQIESNLGIRLIEIRRADEMVKFSEFTHTDPPMIFHVPSEWWKTEQDFENCSIFVVDNEGNVCESGFTGFEQFLKS